MKYANKYLKNESLGKYTTVGIGGPAEYLAKPRDKEEFVNYIKDAISHNIPLTIIGSGSALLISDEGVKGLVVINTFGDIKFEDESVYCDSGVKLQRLADECFKKNLCGLENYSVIPCSIGGAIYNNVHGVNGHLFNEFVVSVEYLDENNEVKTKEKEDCDFGYDKSWFQSKDVVILGINLKFSKCDGRSARQKWNELKEKKLQTQTFKSLGCVFKNLTDKQVKDNNFPTSSTGRLIDKELEMNGYRIGDSIVWYKHCNFIKNMGNATAKDYLQVIKDIEKKAKDKFGIELEREIEVLGF